MSIFRLAVVKTLGSILLEGKWANNGLEGLEGLKEEALPQGIGLHVGLEPTLWQGPYDYI